MQLKLTGSDIAQGTAIIAITAETALEYQLLAIIARRLELKDLEDGFFYRQLNQPGQENKPTDPAITLSKFNQSLTFSIPSGSCWNREYLKQCHGLEV